MYPSRAFAAPMALPVALAAVFLFSGLAKPLAQEVEYVDIRSGKYKMTEYGETGEDVPRVGPIIEVFSKSGVDYDTIANDNKALPFILDLKGRCAGNQRVGKAELTLPDGRENLEVKRRRQSYARNFKKITVRSAFVLPDIGRSPAQACTKELDRRVASSNLSREEWIERGFVVRYDDAYKFGFALTCNKGKGWNQFGEAETTAPVWIACQPSRVAAAGVRQAASGAPAGSGEAGPEASGPTRLTERAKPTEQQQPAPPAELTQLISAMTLRANKGDYQGRCPVALRFSGAVTVSRAGTVRYRLADNEGNRSPLRSLKFAEAGSQSIVGWSKAFAIPAAAEAEAEAEAVEGAADFQGWVQIEVVEPRRVQPSDKAEYRVTCE